MNYRVYSDVNEAFTDLVESVAEGIALGRTWVEKRPSRNGNVYQFVHPTVIQYTNPRKRVLFNRARDCNPFFHLFESLWMLAGRDDVAPLAYYAKNIQQFSDNGATFNGAYGYRWRRAKELFYGDDTDSEYYRYGYDQLAVLIDHLRNKPESRRAVLQMWNVEDDLMKIDSSKDVCCNLSVMFSIRPRNLQQTIPDCSGDNWPSAKRNFLLDMTVTNRSNDMIWGMLGANVVHFSFLQEYMAQALGVGIGTYTQFTNNLHVYEWNWKPDEWSEYFDDDFEYADDVEDQTVYGGLLANGPLLCSQGVADFDKEVRRFIDNPFQDWKDDFLRKVGKPMCEAFKHHKARQYDLAYEAMNRVAADDWQAAGGNWLEKRKTNWEAKQEKTDANYSTSSED